MLKGPSLASLNFYPPESSSWASFRLGSSSSSLALLRRRLSQLLLEHSGSPPAVFCSSYLPLISHLSTWLTSQLLFFVLRGHATPYVRQLVVNVYLSFNYSVVAPSLLLAVLSRPICLFSSLTCVRGFWLYLSVKIPFFFLAKYPLILFSPRA